MVGCSQNKNQTWLKSMTINSMKRLCEKNFGAQKRILQQFCNAATRANSHGWQKLHSHLKEALMIHSISSHFVSQAYCSVRNANKDSCVMQFLDQKKAFYLFL